MDPTLHLYIDVETRSRLDARKAGVEMHLRGAEIIVCGYALGDGEVKAWLPLTQEIPGDLELYLRRPEIKKVAWNAAFERLALTYTLGITIPVSQWVDPAVMARYASLPSGLADTCRILGLEGEGKDKEGKRLIQIFCFPGKRGHKTPEQEPEKFQRFVEYCKQDVVAERAVMRKLAAFALPEQEQRILALDQKINDRGIPVDLQFVQNGIAITDRERERILNEMKVITGLENPNSNTQLLKWLRAQGYPFTSLGKEFVKRALSVT